MNGKKIVSILKDFSIFKEDMRVTWLNAQPFVFKEIVI